MRKGLFGPVLQHRGQRQPKGEGVSPDKGQIRPAEGGDADRGAVINQANPQESVLRTNVNELSRYPWMGDVVFYAGAVDALLGLVLLGSYLLGYYLGMKRQPPAV